MALLGKECISSTPFVFPPCECAVLIDTVQEEVERRRGAVVLSSLVPPTMDPSTIVELSFEGAGIATVNLSTFPSLQRLK
jgi:hypothetical protein